MAESGLRLIPDNAAVAGFFGKYLGYMGTGLSPALLGVGYIVGLNIGIVVLSGSVLSYNIAIPIYSRAFRAEPGPGLRRAASLGRRRLRKRLQPGMIVVRRRCAISASAPC